MQCVKMLPEARRVQSRSGAFNNSIAGAISTCTLFAAEHAGTKLHHSSLPGFIGAHFTLPSLTRACPLSSNSFF